MLTSEHDMEKWKQSQIIYFTNYLNHFPKDSPDYQTICDGIEELKKTIVH